MKFIMLAKQRGLGYEAVERFRELKRPSEKLEDIKQFKPPEGVTITDAYFTLGRYDGVIIIEAENPRKALEFAMKMLFETNFEVETLTALPVTEA